MTTKPLNSAVMCVIDWTLIGIKQFSYISHKYPEKGINKHSVKLLLALVYYRSSEKQVVNGIMLTCPCNVHPLKPHFYIVKFGFTGVYIIFIFLLLNINFWYSLEPPQ